MHSRDIIININNNNSLLMSCKIKRTLFLDFLFQTWDGNHDTHIQNTIKIKMKYFFVVGVTGSAS